MQGTVKNFLEVEGVYELGDRMVDIEMSETEYEWYKQTYGLM